MLCHSKVKGVARTLVWLRTGKTRKTPLCRAVDARGMSLSLSANPPACATHSNKHHSCGIDFLRKNTEVEITSAL